jgi:hypothetical protein
MAHVVTCEDLLTRVQELAPVLRAHADQGERERHLMDPVVESLQDAELYHMLVPRAMGGLQVDPLTLYRVVEAVARVDGSTGWCLFINGCAPISAAFLGDDAAETIYGHNARTIMAGSVFPYGRALRQAGGYRISGRGGGTGLHGRRGQCQLPTQPLAAAAARHPCGDATCVDGAQAIRGQRRAAPRAARQPPDSAPLSPSGSTTTLRARASAALYRQAACVLLKPRNQLVV